AQTAAVVLDALTMLFTIHGAPLVLKRDNGSAFIDEDVRKLLDCWQVFPLFSPPRTPSYNGACEASIGSLKRRTERQAQARTASGIVTTTGTTSDDVAAAQDEANAAPNRRGRGPSRAEVWATRPPLAVDERTRFAESYRGELQPARQEKNYPEGPLTRPQQAAVDRIALRRALVARNYLE